jgi:hypothetical protein
MCRVQRQPVAHGKGQVDVCRGAHLLSRIDGVITAGTTNLSVRVNHHAPCPDLLGSFERKFCRLGDPSQATYRVLRLLRGP